jgi:D-tagatose-1,6-bisphosphate aldolase subunit GatZ/KbaZ
VEFTGDDVFEYDPKAAENLCAALKGVPAPIVFEGHSTDYQNPESLQAMVRDGIAILKVGPALTFALRESLMALECIEKEMVEAGQLSRFMETLDAVMSRDTGNWKHHYRGTDKEIYLQLRYSFFDRARYYIMNDEVEASIKKLIGNLEKTGIPLTLLSQYMPQGFERVRKGLIELKPEELILDHIKHCLRGYAAAAGF